MESGGFTGVFKNAPFDKRSVLRGFRGFRPHFFMTPPDRLAKGRFLVIVRVWRGRNGWDAGSALEFFYFFQSARFLKNSALVIDKKCTGTLIMTRPESCVKYFLQPLCTLFFKW